LRDQPPPTSPPCSQRCIVSCRYRRTNRDQRPWSPTTSSSQR
jgi:hypothetical protein